MRKIKVNENYYNAKQRLNNISASTSAKPPRLFEKSIISMDDIYEKLIRIKEHLHNYKFGICIEEVQDLIEEIEKGYKE